LAVGCILLGLFVKRCSTTEDPLLDLTLFKMPFVVAANLSGFFFSIGFLGMWMLQIQWLQVVWQYSPTRSGLATAAGPLTAAILAAPMGRLAGKWGHAKVLFMGSALLTTGTIGFSLFLGPTPQFLTVYLPLMIICGSGVGCSMSVLSSSATAFLPPGKFAMGSALNTTGRQIGSALGAALALSLTAPTISKLVAGYSSNPPRLPSSSDLSSYLTAWRVMGGIYLFAGIVMVVLYKKPTEQQMAEAGAVQFVD
jgi:MFS family permease